MTAILSVHDARKRFGKTVALNGASLELRNGECLALLGPNGAGKTTLVRAIAGRVRLDDGYIQLGEPHADSKTATGSIGHDRLGIVPQDIALYPLLTARENLRAFGELNGVSGSELRDRIEHALQWTGLEDRADEPIKRFSGGMKRRLNIACGVIHEPDIILLDEPTVGVDPQSRQRIWDMMHELQSRGASLLLTTHQLDEAESICDRIVIIDHGKVIASGTLDALIDQTIGRGRRVSLMLNEPLADGALSQLNANGGGEQDGRALRFQMDDVAVELPPMLAAVHDAHRRVEDVSIEAPSLHHVFLHLTGRELRE